MPIWRHHLFFTCKNPLPQKWKPLSVAGGNVKWDCLCGTLYDDSSKKKKIKIQNTFDPAIPTKVGIWIGICLSVFRAALFIIAKTWRQPPNWWMDKQNMVCSYYWAIQRNGMVTRVQPGWTPNHYILWKKPDTKDHVLQHCIYRKYPQKANYTTRKEISCLGLGVGTGINCKRGDIVGVMKTFLNWVIRMVAQNDKLTKKYCTIHSEQVNFMICNHTSIKPCYSQCVREPAASALLGISSLEKQSLRS